MEIKLDRINFQGRIEKGVLVFDNPAYFRHHIAKYKDCEVKVRVERKRTKRSHEQNAYYWGAVLPTIADATGHTNEELHEAFKMSFLPRQQITIGKKTAYLIGSTAKLSIQEMSDYIERIAAEVAGMGITLPNPESYDWAPTVY